ncbi:tRNA (adenosine(37)-N6)-threonylcarbamoyltransferase complex dimerization subunit type 1 TsaB [Gangjinia marincola]|uniref:tRNA (Adenosine(37)-N6)-threonylcarbamoyltransferase complex dimerization subunit type 1 TsaB n=1 Tax=Gangjinia marincola TaxID=578463 RepID=A0ABN1MEC4_9FLAO
MSRVLCIETSTTNCSVALGQDGELIALKEDNGKQYSHAERLHVYIQELFNQVNVDLREIDAVAVSKGPGSYTGLRIGVSAAKGLCYSLDKPLYAVNTLKALAKQVQANPTDVVIPMLDARRMEVYSAVFSSENELLREIKAEILTQDSFATELTKGKVHFIGNGVAKFQEICTHENAVFYPEALPSAKEMIALADQKTKNSQSEDVAYFEPYYLKDFVAG